MKTQDVPQRNDQDYRLLALATTRAKERTTAFLRSPDRREGAGDGGKIEQLRG